MSAEIRKERSLTLGRAGAEARSHALKVEILADFAVAEADWRRLESLCCASPYQTFAFCRAWLATIGKAEGATALIALARGPDGEPAALLPLGRRRIGLLNCASFLGGRMANYHMGLYREPERFTHTALTALLKEVARQARLDLFLFSQQPFAWDGRPNPMREIGGGPSPSFAYATRLGTSYEAWLSAHYSADARKKRRAKTRRLQALGAVAHRRAQTAQERRAAFEALIAQKRARMAALKLPNEFDDPAVRDFLDQLTRYADSGFEWHVIQCGDRTLSVYGGLAHAGRLSGLLFSHDISPDVAPASPGELMVHALAEDGVARRLEALDFGVGEARYKSEACEIVEPMFDTAFATSPLGMLGAAAFRLARSLKRRAKQSPRLFDLARATQRFLFSRRAR